MKVTFLSISPLANTAHRYQVHQDLLLNIRLAISLFQPQLHQNRSFKLPDEVGLAYSTAACVFCFRIQNWFAFCERKVYPDPKLSLQEWTPRNAKGIAHSQFMISESILDALKVLLACRINLRGVLEIWKVCRLREEGQQARIC